MAIESGWNPARSRWEYCDEGLYFDRKKARSTRRRPHSVPRDSKYRPKVKTTEDMI